MSSTSPPLPAPPVKAAQGKPSRGLVWGMLAFFLLACYGTAAVGSRTTIPEIPVWYAQLNKPTWNPPSWLFGPVWTLLYTLMAIAAWRVWLSPKRFEVRLALALFFCQLLQNAAWSEVFFRFHQPGWALATILLLWVTILATLIAFWRISRAAGWMMVPYLAWVSFATVLNAAIWQLNP